MKYRAVVTWKKLRPYYPESTTNPNHTSAVRDLKNVGEVKVMIIDNGGEGYSRLSTCKAQVRRARESYPLVSIYGDGHDSTEILSIKFESAEPVWLWKKIDDTKP